MGLVTAAGRALAAAGNWLMRDAGLAAELPPHIYDWRWGNRYGGPSSAGMPISDRTALSIPSFNSAVSALAEALASEDWTLTRKLESGGTVPLRGPVAELISGISFAARERAITDMLVCGNSFWRFDGATFEALPRQRMTAMWHDNAVLYWQYAEPSGAMISYEPDELVAFRYRETGVVREFGVPPMAEIGDAMGVSLAARLAAASELRQGTRMRHYLTTEHRLDRAKAAEISERWATNYASPAAAGKVAVLEQALKLESVPLGNLEELQLTQLARMSDADILATLHVPPFIAGLGAGNANRSTAAEEARSFVMHGLRPLARRVANALELFLLHRGLIEPRDYVAIEFRALTAGFGVEASDADAKAIAGGFMCPNEARAERGWPPMPGGDEIFRAVNLETVAHAERRADRQDELAAAKTSGELPPGSTPPTGAGLAGHGTVSNEIDPAELEMRVSAAIMTKLAAELVSGPQEARRQAQLADWSRTLIEGLKRELHAEHEQRQAESRAAEMAAEIDETEQLAAFRDFLTGSRRHEIRAQLASRRMEG
jgi:HK97 family phage portal protein